MHFRQVEVKWDRGNHIALWDTLFHPAFCLCEFQISVPFAEISKNSCFAVVKYSSWRSLSNCGDSEF